MRILTVDLEDWFHCDMMIAPADAAALESRVVPSTRRILEALGGRNQRATFFCLGWIARRHPDLVREIQAAGHEIGCHSDLHRLVPDLGPEEFRKDTGTAVKTLEDITGAKIRAYRAPAFSITEREPWAFEALIENGLEIDCSVFPAAHDFGGFRAFGEAGPAVIEIGGARIKEFPMSAARLAGRTVVYSGGGYFRLYPYWLVRRLLARSPYAMAYFHPRDFDAGQPVKSGLTPVRRFKSYYGLAGAYGKFERLLGEFDFAGVSEAADKVRWDEARIVRLR